MKPGAKTKTSKIKLPLITKNSRPVFAADNLCQICGVRIGDPNTFVALMGGAMIQNDDATLGMDKNLYGFLEIAFHGAHDKGNGRHRNLFVNIPLVEGSMNGQFDICFCSLAGIRTFFNQVVDLVQKKLKTK